MLHASGVVLLLLILSVVVSPNSTVLHRRKRYLAFPPKANIVMTLALLKGIPYDIKASPTTKVITTYECDVLFPLPRDPSPFRLATSGAATASRHRRYLHGQIEELLDMNGIDGRSCVKAAICQTKNRKHSNFENLAEDLLRIVFGEMNDDVKAEFSDKVCSQSLYNRCSIAIIDIALEWAHRMYVELREHIN